MNTETSREVGSPSKLPPERLFSCSVPEKIIW